jgi:hypothetical protein
LFSSYPTARHKLNFAGLLFQHHLFTHNSIFFISAQLVANLRTALCHATFQTCPSLFLPRPFTENSCTTVTTSHRNKIFHNSRAEQESYILNPTPPISQSLRAIPPLLPPHFRPTCPGQNARKLVATEPIAGTKPSERNCSIKGNIVV